MPDDAGCGERRCGLLSKTKGAAEKDDVDC